MSLGSQAFSDVLPFDVEFIIKCTPGANDLINFEQVIGIDCWYGDKDTIDIPRVQHFPAVYLKKNHITGYIDVANKQFTMFIPPLPPSKRFVFFFKVTRKNDPKKTDVISAINQEIQQTINEAAQMGAKRGSYEFSDPTYDTILSKVEKQAINILNQKI